MLIAHGRQIALRQSTTLAGTKQQAFHAYRRVILTGSAIEQNFKVTEVRSHRSSYGISRDALHLLPGGEPLGDAAESSGGRSIEFRVSN
eukprot:1805926-Pleurochrysis_carterae.AAC.2